MRIILILCLIASIFTFDVEVATKYLTQHAHPQPTNWCAKYVHDALEAGGIKMTRQPDAITYRNSGVIVSQALYKEISKPSSFKKGDITITEANQYHEFGHIAMWNGTKWISDFIQKSEFSYLEHQPPVHYYRYNGPDTTGLVFTYQVKTYGGVVSAEINNANGIAAVMGHCTCYFRVKVNRGSLKYRVHYYGGKWTNYVTGYNWADSKNGYVGVGYCIDSIQIIYNDNNDLPNYRVANMGANFYPWQKGSHLGDGYGGYAGWIGYYIERIQISP